MCAPPSTYAKAVYSRLSSTFNYLCLHVIARFMLHSFGSHSQQSTSPFPTSPSMLCSLSGSFKTFISTSNLISETVTAEGSVSQTTILYSSRRAGRCLTHSHNVLVYKRVRKASMHLFARARTFGTVLSPTRVTESTWRVLHRSDVPDAEPVSPLKKIDIKYVDVDKVIVSYLTAVFPTAQRLGP